MTGPTGPTGPTGSTGATGPTGTSYGYKSNATTLLFTNNNSTTSSNAGSWIELSGSDIEFGSTMDGTILLSTIIGVIGCVVEGTQITMSDGSKKNVEYLRTGDEVLSYDLTNQKYVPAVVILSMKEKVSRHIVQNLFSDGSVLSTVGEHHVYNTKGSPTSNIEDWANGDCAYNQKLEEVEFCGRFTYSCEGKNTYNVLTSNSIYFADGIMNTCFPPAKFNHLKLRHIEMPEELFDIVKPELDYSRAGAHRTNKTEFLQAALDLENRYTQVSDNIKKRKEQLDKTDYQTVKTSEKFMKALLEAKSFDEYKQMAQAIYDEDTAAKLAERKAARDEIVATERLNDELYQQIIELKKQYGIITDYDSLSLQEQFRLCNKLGNDNLELYRAWPWIQRCKEISAEK